MMDMRLNRTWTFAGAFALVLTAGVAAKHASTRHDGPAAVGEDLRDAVASSTPPATVGLAGKPVPTSWFKTPAEQRVEVDSALFSSRRRRALPRRVAAR